MKIQNIFFGPYIGDFATEILTIRPYARWVYEILKPSKMFISTHSNRCFLYDWATPVPVFEDLSRDELNQNGTIHNSISQKDLNIITKKVKTDIIKLLLPEKDLTQISVPYSKNIHWYPLYKKMYKPVEISSTVGDKIVFIPNINEKYAITKEIYDYLCDNFGDRVIVAGDMKTHLHENNIMFRNPTYFKDIYMDMVQIITEAKVVITPNSHWTLLSQLQSTPVFSWGVFPQYYENDVKNMILPEGIPLQNIKSMISNFINSIK